MNEVNFLLQLRSLLRVGALQDHVAELRLFSKDRAEVHVHDAVLRVGDDLRLHLRLEISRAFVKSRQRLGGALHVRSRVRTFGRILRHLQKPGIREPFERARKVVHAEIHSGLQDQHHADAVHVWEDLHLNILLRRTGLQVLDGLLDLRSREWLADFLREIRFERGRIDVRTASDLETRDALSLVRLHRLLLFRGGFGGNVAGRRLRDLRVCR
jgi:hypothetical protein